MPIVPALLALIQYAPSAITEITAVVNAIRGTLSATDQATIDQALATAQAADAAATANADIALGNAANR